MDYTRYDTDGTSVIVHTEYDYLDDIGWLMYVENRDQVLKSGATVISSFQYYKTTKGDEHDCVGNRKYMEFDGGANVANTYDDRYQLETEARYTSTAQTTGAYRYTWSYDDAGNRLTQLKEEWDSGWVDKNYTEYTYNAANQLIDEDRWDDDNYTTWEAETIYAYDDAGNMTDKTYNDKTVANDDVDWDYTYNYENRQTKVEKDTGGGMTEVGEYIYNVLGNRVSREVNQTTTYEMYYDGADCVGDDDGSTESYFITPGLDENLMINNGSDYFYTQDGLGSVRELLNTNQATQNTYDYEAFGSPYDAQSSPPVTNRYTYTGREWDSESATYYCRTRQYYPTFGRFGARDRLFANYPYVDNCPVGNIDPYGLKMRHYENKDWHLVRNSGWKRALVCAKSNGTLATLGDSLARMTEMDPGDIDKWAWAHPTRKFVVNRDLNPPGFQHPGSGQKVSKATRVKKSDMFTVPNVMYLRAGELDIAYFLSTMARFGVEFSKREQSALKLLVFIHNSMVMGFYRDWYEACWGLHSDEKNGGFATDYKKALEKDWNMFGFWYIGHGSDDEKTKDVSFFGVSGGAVSARNTQVHHKLGRLFLNCCYSSKYGVWKQKVSKYGTFAGNPGIALPIAPDPPTELLLLELFGVSVHLYGGKSEAYERGDIKEATQLRK